MKNRSCQLWLAIVSAGGTVKRYSLKPLAAAELGAAFVAGYRLLNRSESPSPVYHVRLSPSAVLSCTCPAFVWDGQRGQAKAARPTSRPRRASTVRAPGRRLAAAWPRAAARRAKPLARSGPSRPSRTVTWNVKPPSATPIRSAPPSPRLNPSCGQ